MEDPEEVARRQAKLAVEAIASFDVHALDGQELTSSYDLPVSTGTTYFSDVAARHARERRGIQLRVVRMVNDFDILMVIRAGDNAFRTDNVRKINHMR